VHLRNVDLNILLVLYALLGEVYAISQEWVPEPLHICSSIPYQFVEQTSLVLVYVTSELSELLFAPGLKRINGKIVESDCFLSRLPHSVRELKPSLVLKF
jgi:hypothetical protein